MSDDRRDSGEGERTEEAQEAADAAENAGRDAATSDDRDKLVHLRPPRPCPTCGKASTRKSYPFCSARCADVDLNRWLSGQFVIPGRSLTDTDEDKADGFGAPVNESAPGQQKTRRDRE